jgi:hypothetical protein
MRSMCVSSGVLRGHGQRDPRVTERPLPRDTRGWAAIKGRLSRTRVVILSRRNVRRNANHGGEGPGREGGAGCQPSTGFSPPCFSFLRNRRRLSEGLEPRTEAGPHQLPRREVRRLASVKLTLGVSAQARTCAGQPVLPAGSCPASTRTAGSRQLETAGSVSGFDPRWRSIDRPPLRF